MTPEPNIGSPLFYGVFFIAVLIMIGIDMLSLKKTGAHKVSTKEALLWSAIWIAVSCAFAGWLYWEISSNPAYGHNIAKTKVIEYFTGYVLEKSLAVDNLFVFLMIFSYFKVPPQYQHRVLLYGVFGAIVLRAIMIFIGAVLVSRFEWILYIFGAFLLYTGIKMVKQGGDEEGEDLSQNKILQWLQKHIRVGKSLNGEKFFTVENGKRVASPLLIRITESRPPPVLVATCGPAADGRGAGGLHNHAHGQAPEETGHHDDPAAGDGTAARHPGAARRRHAAELCRRLPADRHRRLWRERHAARGGWSGAAAGLAREGGQA